MLGALAGVVAGLIAVPGCGPTIVPSFDSPEPAARNSAIVRAGSARDPAAVPDLVRMLDSDDPATRFLAIKALYRITGERLGYEAVASEPERLIAIERWRAFANDFRPRSSASPGEAP
jgi:HEAT repeat protein